MYIPPSFEQPDIAAMHALMKSRPLATVVTLSLEGLEANHLPLHLSPEEGRFGVLRGHVARANPISGNRVPDVEALAVFHGPNSYVSPTWYPSKRQNGKVVPTWNYAVVHAHGTLNVIDDHAWLRDHLQAFTAQQEKAFSEPWTMTDAPAEFLERLVGAVVGIELVIKRIRGKWKAGQNQSQENRNGVVRGLQRVGTDEAREMAALVEAADRQLQKKDRGMP